MDEKKLLDRIKKSGECVDAPDSLEPEHMKRLLEESRGGWKHRWSKYARWGISAAASVLLIVGVVSAMSRLGGGVKPEETASLTQSATEASTLSQTESAHLADSGTEQALDSESDAEREDAGELYAFAGASTYGEVYQALAGAGYRAARGMGEYAAADVGVRENGAMKQEMDADTATGSASGASAGGYSATNLQEIGVDEADIIKTDGNYLYVLKATGSVQIVKADGQRLELESSVETDELNESPQEMYLDGDILSVIVTGSVSSVEDEKDDVYQVNREDYTKVCTYDISDRSAPKQIGSVRQQGDYATSRKNGDMIYLFTSYYPEEAGEEEIDGYIPAVQGARLNCEDIYLPEYKNSPSYLVISSVDIESPGEVVDKKAVVSGSDMFYVSQESIYIANTDWSSDTTMTQILKFGYHNGHITGAEAADLKGELNDTFSLNEYNGYLRAVLTDYSGEAMRNALYVLDGGMEVVGSIQDIAEGESIQSARFFGDTGYFVTFRNMDPLFSVDLSDPANPKILGELKVTGFSSYLHFYGENLLLGVGDEVDPETGEYLGIKLSMFDISDPANVREIHKYVIKGSYDCPVCYNYKAAMIDVEKNLFGFMCDENYMVFTYHADTGFENVFTENFKDAYYSSYYDGIWGMRGCYIGDTLYLIGQGKILIYDMADGYRGVGKLEL